MKVISVTNKKGGTGKTTTAYLLGIGLAKKGYRVLLMDLDWQCHLSYMAGAELNRGNILDVLERRVELKDTIQTMGNLLYEIDIVPGSGYLSNNNQDLDWCFMGKSRTVVIKNLLSPIKENYDYIIMDLDKEYDIVSINALIASDSVIIPCEYSTLSLLALAQVSNILSSIKEYNPALKVDGILLTQVDHQISQDEETINEFESFAQVLETKIFDTVIRKSVIIPESQAYEEDLFSYAPNAKATQDYLNFIDEFLAQEQPVELPTSITSFFINGQTDTKEYIEDLIQRNPPVPTGYKICRLENKTERMQILLTPTLKTMGKEQAKSLGMSFNEYVNYLIEKDLGLPQ